ncbi:M20/M25/M40 family metallo-hydrolase [Montanilutibacter psychrotolerans]|uniref:M20/M25/M40 family metallo-hydrolase n=1 Tax=Montanilutibacter psychrotolerans TaxID=1327343 RepID=A0A3M8SR59_9GAMM|nr:M20/M25/M40 family metallo-hydrolase [Lysobacter psychrotolerans]RNF83797.1 M20/M25/M40 family metallo-hydrolase [Lysobacter psychrotolerans]
MLNAIKTCLLASMVCSVLYAGTSLAQSRPVVAPPVSAVVDPHAPVYVVTSRATWQGQLQTIAPDATSRRDSLGRELVVSRIRNHQVSDLARHVHENEKRCGGFFAFDSQAAADRFIRDDRSAQALARASLVAYTIDNGATVNPWLGAVDANRIKSTITHLSSYTNRYFSAPTGKTSAEWIKSNWDSITAGRSDISSELFACSNCSTQPSVILTIQGAELPSEIVVLGAHLDSINGSGGGSSTQVAPGADDDASGIATLTEVLQVAVANGWRPKRTVKFMGYAAEEVGLRGSNAIAQSFASASRNVVGVLQLDMTNYQTGGTEMRIVSDYSNAEMKTFLANLFDTYLAPLGIQRGTYTCGYGCSDHASWTSAGYPAAIMFEGGDSGGGYNPNIHTTGDTLANMGNTAAPSAHFAKLGLAFLGELGKTAGTGGNTPPVANFSSTVSGLTATFTDSSSDSDGTIASRSWNFGDGTTSTATNPSKTYTAAGTYTVSLTVTDDDGATNTKTQSVSVGTVGNVLTKGVPVTGLSAAAGASLNYTMVVPTGASNLTFTMSGGTGDADMYVKFGSAPTDTVYDCRPYTGGNAETCTFAAPQAGTYHVRLKGYSAFSGVSLVGDYGTGGGGTQTYSNATDYAIGDNATVDSPITVSGRTGNAPSNASVTVAIVHTYQGDLKVDLVAPDGSLYNLHNRTGGSADNINKTVTLNLSTEALNGTWKLRVNDNAGGDTGKIDSWTITF